MGTRRAVCFIPKIHRNHFNQTFVQPKLYNQMNRSTLLLCSAALLLTGCTPSEQKQTAVPHAKYVFYFISDGTGVNTVLGAEMYQAELEGRIGRKQLCLTQFPVVGVSSTYSASHGVTDSAASGTALASGNKTYNRAVGIAADHETPIYSVAVWAKNSGARVGVATSVCVNHATPAAFYAHRPDRGMYYQIGLDLPVAGFDFYGGSDFNQAQSPADSLGTADLYTVATDSGYVIARGYEDFVAKAPDADRMILFQTQEVSDRDAFSLPYALDAQPGQLTIPQVLQAEIDFLMKDSTNGFFLMNEIGGKVDFACHANDGATAFAEVAAVDSCIRIAYDFYLRHPNETLIVLTADHETGGLVINGNRSKELNLALLGHQKCSQDAFTAILHDLRAQTSNRVTWEQVKAALTENYGFWDAIKLTEDEEKALYTIYTKSFRGQMPTEKNLYSENEPLAGEANRIINAKAGLTWCTGGHSAGLVPVYACGVGAERFSVHNDNARIPRIIAEIAGYTIPE
jgi:alkaline phosphatase